MLDSVLIARDKWLAPGGIMMPNRAKMYVATVDDEAFYRKKLVIPMLSRTIGMMSME